MWRGKPVLAFCLGLLAGGVLILLAFLLVGSVVRVLIPVPVRIALLAVGGVALVLRELGAVSFAMPENRRLVPDTVFRLGSFWGPFQFGLEMGTGVRTYLPSSTSYLVAGTIALFGTPLTTLAAGVGWGLGRSLMTVSSTSYDDAGTWDALWSIHERTIKGVLVALFVLCWTGFVLLSR